jgi:hypothetical protein
VYFVYRETLSRFRAPLQQQQQVALAAENAASPNAASRWGASPVGSTRRMGYCTCDEIAAKRLEHDPSVAALLWGVQEAVLSLISWSEQNL